MSLCHHPLSLALLVSAKTSEKRRGLSNSKRASGSSTKTGTGTTVRTGELNRAINQLEARAACDAENSPDLTLTREGVKITTPIDGGSAL